MKLKKDERVKEEKEEKNKTKSVIYPQGNCHRNGVIGPSPSKQCGFQSFSVGFSYPSL